jgi:hypothetical protein
MIEEGPRDDLAAEKRRPWQRLAHMAGNDLTWSLLPSTIDIQRARSESKAAKDPECGERVD